MLRKKITFIIILVSIPIFSLIFLEAILYSIGYDKSAKTIVTIERNGKKYYTINQLVGKKYFNENRLYYRKGQHDYFEVEKSSNTLRIFCFGASTTAGFPYEYNAIPTEFLRQQLVALFPNKNIEVINTAIAATNSFTVLDMEKELINYQPDMFIVYTGQNEFYGAFGVGSTVSLGKNRTLIKTHLWLHKFRTYLLLKNIILSLFSNNQNNKENITLMEDMIQNNSISLNSNDYFIAKETFKNNYEEIIETARENDIPIIISTLVTNEKDLLPFVSLHKKSIKKTELNKFEQLFDSGIRSKKNKNFKDAVNYFKQAITIDSTFAKAHFYLGKCYVELKDYNKAKKEFILANNLDGLKFRAPSEFNSIIIELSKKYHIPLANVYDVFRNNSPSNILGNELLIDHLHPNIKGYVLLSKTWVSTLKNNYQLGLSPNDTLNEKNFWESIPVTELDSTIGEIKILKLKSQPPFQSTNNKFVFRPTNFLEQQVYSLTIKNEISWGIAHINMAERYYQQNLFYKAIKELNAVLITDDSNPIIYTMIGDAYFSLKDYQAAEKNYFKVYELTDDIAIMKRLASVELKLNKPSNAIVLLENCLKHFNNFQTSNNIEEIQLNLALAYYQANNQTKAKKELEIILDRNPQNNKAFSLLKKIEITGTKNL